MYPIFNFRSWSFVAEFHYTPWFALVDQRPNMQNSWGTKTQRLEKQETQCHLQNHPRNMTEISLGLDKTHEKCFLIRNLEFRKKPPADFYFYFYFYFYLKHTRLCDYIPSCCLGCNYNRLLSRHWASHCPWQGEFSSLEHHRWTPSVVNQTSPLHLSLLTAVSCPTTLNLEPNHFVRIKLSFNLMGLLVGSWLFYVQKHLPGLVSF